MGNALKIIFYALVIALLFLWALTVAEKCNNKKLNADQTEESTDDLLDGEFSDDISDLTDDISDDEVEDLTIDDEVEDLTDENEEVSFEDLSNDEEPADYSDLTEPVKAAEKPKTVQTPTRKAPQGVAGGQFLLVAGNYSVHSNAQQMISKLKRMGYDRAEIVQFDNSNFSTVVASRFDDYDKATSAKATLVGRGIDCYVHKQKF